MGATRDEDKFRLLVDDILVDLMSAEDHVRVAGVKVERQARTVCDDDVLAELRGALKRLRAARASVAGLHKNRRG